MSALKGRSFLYTTVNLLLSSSIFSLAAVTASRRPEFSLAVGFTGTLHRAFTKQTLSTPVRSLCCPKPPGSGSAHVAGRGAERIKDSTLRWLKEVVIGFNLCPWANSALMTGAIRLVVSHSRNEEELLKEIVREASALSKLPPSPNATTLVVTEHLLEDFVLDYVPFINSVDDAIDDLELRGIVQLATFHPVYQFAHKEPGDAENWTNRSPFPMLHLLREKEVSAALENYGNPDKVWQRNEKLMHSKGAAAMQEILNSCSIRPDQKS